MNLQVDIEDDSCNDALLELTNLGKVVPRDASIVYLYELQNACRGFRGFDMDEVTMLCEAFPIVSFGPNVQIIKAGEEAFFTALVLQGCARSYTKQASSEFVPSLTKDRKAVTGKETTMDNFEKGEFLGANAFLDCSPTPPGSTQGDTPSTSESSQQPHHVKLTGAVNVLLLISHRTLRTLNQANPHLGNHLMRLMAEAASSRVFARSGAPPMPSTDNVASKPELWSIFHHLQGKQGSVIHGFTDAEVRKLLEFAELVSFQQGEQVFTEGHQAHVALVLLRGALETRLGSGITFLSPGDTLGECVFPNIVHKKDAFAKQNSLFLQLTMSSLYKLNAEEPALGHKFTHNLIRETLGKMNKVFAPGGIAYNPEWREPSEKDKEVVELRWVAAEGMHQLLRGGVKALESLGEGSAVNCLGSPEVEVGNYSGRSAVMRLESMLEKITTRVTEKNHKMSEMLPKKDVQSMQQKVERLEKTEFQLRQEGRDREKRIQALEHQTLDLQDQIEKLKDKVKDKTATIKELRESMEQQKEDNNHEMKRINDETIRLRKKLAECAQTTSDDLWTTLTRQNEARLEKLRKDNVKLEESNQDMKYKMKNMEIEIGQMKKREKHGLDENYQDQEDLSLLEDESEFFDVEEDEDETFDETIPMLTSQLENATKTNCKIRWMLFCSRLLEKMKLRTTLQNSREVAAHFRTQAQEGFKFKGISEDLQRRVSELEDAESSLRSQLTMLEGSNQEVQDELQKRYGEVNKFPEMQMLQMKVTQLDLAAKRAIDSRKMLLQQMDREAATLSLCNEELASLGQLLGWLVLPVLESEAKREPIRLLWRKPKVEALKSAWGVLTRRSFITAPEVLLNIDSISTVLTKRGEDSFKGMMDHVDTTTKPLSDNLAALLVPSIPGGGDDDPLTSASPRYRFPVKSVSSARQNRRSSLSEHLLPDVNRPSKMNSKRRNFSVHLGEHVARLSEEFQRDGMRASIPTPVAIRGVIKEVQVARENNDGQKNVYPPPSQLAPQTPPARPATSRSSYMKTSQSDADMKSMRRSVSPSHYVSTAPSRKASALVGRVGDLARDSNGVVRSLTPPKSEVRNKFLGGQNRRLSYYSNLGVWGPAEDEATTSVDRQRFRRKSTA